MLQLKELAPGIYMAPVPVPFPMGTVNCIIARGEGGWIVVDVGYKYPPAIAAWKEYWSQLGLDCHEITDVYVTHYHVDHFGLVGWFQRECGARVWMSAREIAALKSIWQIEHDRLGVLVDFFRRHGTPQAVLLDLGRSVEKVLQGMEPWGELFAVNEGAELVLGGHSFRVLMTPGHTPGHICLYSESLGFLVAGDHVLPRITPNVSLWPESDPQPLEDYLRSLAKVRALSANLAVPSHGEPFSGLAGRVDEILLHHERRLDAMWQAVDPEASTAWEVSQRVFGEDLDIMDQRFALTETLAHLEYLVADGRLSRQEDGVVRYVRR